MKIRLDDFLVTNNLVSTKSKAKQHITNRKEVYVNQQLISKAGFMVNELEDKVELKIDSPVFVSRAGLKLNKAVILWNLKLKNKVCLDIGASTGGFTQVCLQNDAKLVYALDVGVDQLDKEIKTNKNVIDMPSFNFRDAKKSDFDNEIEFFCCDVSFISLDKILPTLQEIINNNVEGVVLLKPEFEIIKEKNQKKLNKQNHFNVIKEFVNYASLNGFMIKDISHSPILGNKKKNIEYIVHLFKSDANGLKWNNSQIDMLVSKVWKEFNK